MLARVQLYMWTVPLCTHNAAHKGSAVSYVNTWKYNIQHMKLYVGMCTCTEQLIIDSVLYVYCPGAGYVYVHSKLSFL
jgi:hypothetical protein